MSIIDTTQDITVADDPTTDDPTTGDPTIGDIAQDIAVTDDTGTSGTVTAGDVAEQVAAEEVAGARVVQIDPHALIVEENIRQEVNLPRQFVASIRQHGVIVPILAHPDVDGNIVVRDGQRRVLAARDADAATVPAYVVDADDEKRVRIIQQIITNDHRDALTDADRATAWRQLALDGMSVTAIAKQTGAKREHVKTGLAVAGHDIAKTAVAEHDITLDQALVLIEFEDDPDALATLREVAKKNPESFDHHAQRLLDDKATKEEIATLRADYEAQGYTVVDWPGWDDTDTLFLRDLQTADGEPLTEENYAGKPGHAVAIGERWGGAVSVAHVVVDWKAHGLRKIGSTGTVAGGKMTEEEKAQRRTLIANNKAWVSAEKVRREWLAAMMNRKRLPKDALPFAVITLASEDFEVGKAVTDHHRLAGRLLGYEYRYGHQPLATHVQDAPTKAPQIALALAVGALEAATDKNTWRNPDATARRYFQQLADWGYTLSDVENTVLGITPETATGEKQETTGDDTGQTDNNHDSAETAEPEDAPVEAGDTGDTPDEAEHTEAAEADATADDEGTAEALAA